MPMKTARRLLSLTSTWTRGPARPSTPTAVVTTGWPGELSVARVIEDGANRVACRPPITTRAAPSRAIAAATSFGAERLDSSEVQASFAPGADARRRRDGGAGASSDSIGVRVGPGPGLGPAPLPADRPWPATRRCDPGGCRP